MDILFLCVIAFLFLLAIFDLFVGVSNDAVNFLNSSIGSRAASFKRVLMVASVGVFLGAAMSNGMMDIARHGIFRPEHFAFYDLICIFMAVMVTDVILLDIFNTLGMPTSTTVSMVFELLGASFVVSLIKMASDTTGLGLADLLNTEKALSVILGIFLSVAIAFFFGTVVQLVARTIFSFNYKSRLKWKIGIFGGLCATAIVYFLLIKGAKDLAFMTPEVKGWIKTHTLTIIVACLASFTLLMQLLHALRVNVLKVIVLMGTFALAMAFAGNDLVNFIGVPLSGLASYRDFAANGAGDAQGFMMGSLNAPANTPVGFLIGAGAIMVLSLATSKKARNVTKTEIGLGSRDTGDEMFGSSRLARQLVRWVLSAYSWVKRVTPARIRNWFGRRFDVDETIMEQGAAFDLIRGSVNLVLAGALIALGTSLKLPLSTTFVTFMVAMGTSLADRAWGRESAVFRITGVISVIGGWFLTAGAAFIGAGIIVFCMYKGGTWVMFALAALTVCLLIRSNLRFRAKATEEESDTLFHTILATEDDTQTWDLLLRYITEQQRKFLLFARTGYGVITDAFFQEAVRRLGKAEEELQQQKRMLKNARRKETLCLRRVTRRVAIEKSAWFHLANNCCMSMLYNLRRIDEVCKEHVENNFLPLAPCYIADFDAVRAEVVALFDDTQYLLGNSATERIPELRRRCEEAKSRISGMYHQLHDRLHEGDPAAMTVLYVYLNLLQETREMVSNLRKYLRAYAKLHDTEFSGHTEENERVKLETA